MRTLQIFAGGCFLSLVLINVIVDFTLPSWKVFTHNSPWMFLVIAPCGAVLAVWSKNKKQN